jgi:hypothetical protein
MPTIKLYAISSSMLVPNIVKPYCASISRSHRHTPAPRDVKIGFVRAHRINSYPKSLILTKQGWLKNASLACFHSFTFVSPERSRLLTSSALLSAAKQVASYKASASAGNADGLSSHILLCGALLGVCLQK